MDHPPRCAILRLACAFCLLPLASEGGSAADSAAFRGFLSSALRSDSLAMRFGLSEGSSYLGLGLDSCEDGSFLQGCLDLASDPERNMSLTAGPGSASGSLRLLADPSSLTALSPGPLVGLDRSLGSRSAILGLEAGPISIFGIAQGRGPFAFASRSGGLAGTERSIGAAAGGLSLRRTTDEYRLEALAAASYAGNAAPASGWRPDPYTSLDPGSGGGALPLAQGAVIVEREEGRGRALAAVSGSYGSLAGPALAFRLEAREIAGPLDLSLRAAAADPAFRALFGKREESLAGAAADARLAFRRSGSVSASVETAAAGRGRRYAPQWGEASALKLVLPFGIESMRVLETRFEAKRSAEGIVGESCALSLERGRAEEGGSASVAAELSWGKSFEGIAVKLATKAAAEGGLPSLGLDLGIELFDGGSAASPVLAKGGLGITFPWGSAGSLELDADLPENGIALEPLLAPRGGIAASAPETLVFGLRYKAAFSAFPRGRE